MKNVKDKIREIPEHVDTIAKGVVSIIEGFQSFFGWLDEEPEDTEVKAVVRQMGKEGEE